MRRLWRWMIGLALVLPALAFAAGALTGTDIDVPAERPPIVIQDAESSTVQRPGRAAADGDGGRPAGVAPPPVRRPAERDRSDMVDDDVEVVNPRPDDIETVDDDAGRDDEPDDDTRDDTGDDTGDDTREDAEEDAGDDRDDD